MTESTTTRVLTVALGIALVGAVLAGGGAFGQEADDGATQQTAYLRVVHASPDAPAVDVAVDNETVLSNVSFGEVSEYLALSPGEHDVTITEAGDEDVVVLASNVTLASRTVSTLAATGEVSTDPPTIDTVRYLDDAFTPDENESAISVFHLSPDAPTVDVTADNGSVVLANNVSFRGASDYVTVPAGNYTVEVRTATGTNDGSVVATANVSLEGGTAYSALALGYLNPEEAAANMSFRVALTEDATTTVEFPGEEAAAPVTTETPQAATTPGVTETPEATETPQVTGTPAVTETPATEETPVPTETPVETGTPIVEGT